jgi:hypothetical protein
LTNSSFQMTARLVHVPQSVEGSGKIAESVPHQHRITRHIELCCKPQKLGSRPIFIQCQAQPTAVIGHLDEIVERYQRAGGLCVLDRGNEVFRAASHPEPRCQSVHLGHLLDWQIGNQPHRVLVADGSVGSQDALGSTPLERSYGISEVNTGESSHSSAREVTGHHAGGDDRTLASGRLPMVSVALHAIHGRQPRNGRCRRQISWAK